MSAGCGTPPASDCGPSTGTVSSIIDGDTVHLSDGSTVRYLMVDTPEKGDCFSQEARAFNRTRVLNREVRLQYDHACKDKYGRLLAYVESEGREINSLLVEEGFACVLYIPPNGATRVDEFSALLESAREHQRGMWAACRNNPCL